MPNNAVKGILEDSAGNLWLSTGNGLSRFDPRTRTFKNYYSDDGLRATSSRNQRVLQERPRGDVLWRRERGRGVLPEKVVDSPFVPPVVLTDFRLFNEPVPIGGKSPLKRSITYTDSLTLSHAQSISPSSFGAELRGSITEPVSVDAEPLHHSWNRVDADRRLATFKPSPAEK